VPDNLYRLSNRYECPSETGIDERFSTSASLLAGLQVHRLVVNPDPELTNSVEVCPVIDLDSILIHFSAVQFLPRQSIY
jgi:hypothetical protein